MFENDVDTKLPKTTVADRDPKINLVPPPMYQVLLHNDDYTPMEFVVLLLKRFFQMSEEQANVLMYEVHTKGSAVCGVFTRDVAETKVAQVTEFARESNHPLLCTLEKT